MVNLYGKYITYHRKSSQIIILITLIMYYIHLNPSKLVKLTDLFSHWKGPPAWKLPCCRQTAPMVLMAWECPILGIGTMKQ